MGQIETTTFEKNKWTLATTEDAKQFCIQIQSRGKFYMKAADTTAPVNTTGALLFRDQGTILRGMIWDYFPTIGGPCRLWVYPIGQDVTLALNYDNKS